MKTALVLSLALIAQSSFAYQPADGCHWATESTWSCTAKTGKDYAQLVLSIDWSHAQVSTGTCNPNCTAHFSNTFNFTKLDGNNDTYADNQGHVLSLASGSCNADTIDVNVLGQSFHCE